jgi:hypothetical protein
LREIENCLLTHQLIKEAVVTASEGDRIFLSAYIIVKQKFDLTELREYLSQQLPHYMIPSYIIPLEKLPLTANGKIDRKALPTIQTDLRTELDEYTAPETSMEKIIVNVWREVLKQEKISIHHNFFEVGGNSLDMIKINARLKKTIGRDIPVITMFEYPTVYSLSRCLEEKETGERYIGKNIDQFEAKNISKKKLRQRKKRVSEG